MSIIHDKKICSNLMKSAILLKPLVKRTMKGYELISVELDEVSLHYL